MKTKITCPICKQKLRIPITSKRLKITCPRCSSIFFYEIKLPKFIKKIKSYFESKKKLENNNSYYSSNVIKFIHPKNIFKYFIIWFLIIIFLFSGACYLKNNNTERLKEAARKQILKQYDIEKNAPINKKNRTIL